MQVLAELYHIQPPLLPEDSSPSAGADPPVACTSQTTTDSTRCGQPTQATPRPVAACPSASANGGDSFISRQQLGISDTPDAAVGDTPDAAVGDTPDAAVGDTPDAAIADSGLLEDALTATAGAGSAGTPGQGSAASPLATGPDVDQLPAKLGQASVKALCSQEWKIQHVSLSAT